MIEGGIRMPMLPPAASAPVASRSSYPALRISGSAIRVMVAAVTIEDPHTAPKQAEAAMVAIASPPRTPDNSWRAALNRSADSRVFAATSPRSTNSGITDRVYADDTSKADVPARVSALGSPDRVRLPTKPTSASAANTGTRTNNSPRSERMPRAPMRAGLTDGSATDAATHG